MRRTSEDTKAAILAAARERFAADGYEKATIRAIAADVGIDPAMVMRYFGAKEKLFAAAAHIDLRFPDLTATAPEEVGAAMVRHFLSLWEADEALQVLLRTGVTNEAAAGRMREIFAAQLAPVAARLCPDPASAPVRAGLAASQILGMALARYILRLPPVVAMTHDEIVAWLGPTLQRYLTA
ncbi:MULTISPECIES: TetR/AcrR family transcriptional regulator [unclassified Nonomuraea]|uniref:TetR/AcrR family transcriptional regulator n=1 Tax=Nonomuraea sp. NPDC003804 TaxID=3154547 RepID=UPI00339E5470